MELIEIYKALSDRSRLRILKILSNGSFSVGELTDILKLSQPTVSHHLRCLDDLVNKEKDGTWVYYSLNDTDSPELESTILSSYLTATENLNGDSLAKDIRSDEQRVNKALSKRRDSSHRYFESVASDWNNIRHEATGSEPLLNELHSLIPQGGSFLELGCGTGVLLNKVTPREGKTIGIDNSQAMLDEAKGTLEDREVDLRLGHLEHLPLRDKAVDVAAAFMVMHHVAEPKDALKDAYRVLKRGGSLVIVDLVRHTKEYMRERYADLWLGFEPRIFKRWVESVGFTDTEVHLLGEEKEAFLLSTKKPEGMI